MQSPSKDSPSKKYKLNQPSKQQYTQSFRSKTQKAISLINKHEQQKYNFLKTLTHSKKFINHSPHQDQQYYSIVQIPQIFIQQSIKVQLLPYTDQIYKIINPFYFNQNEQSPRIQQHDDQTSSQGTVPIQNSQIKYLPKKNNKQKTKNPLNKSQTQSRNQRDHFQSHYKLKIYIKNFRGASSQLLIYFQNTSSIKDFNIHFHKFAITTQKIININMEDFVNKKWIYLRTKSRSQLSMFTMRVQKQHQVKKKLVTEISQILNDNSKNQTHKKLPQLKGSRSLKTIKSTQLSTQKPQTLKKSGGSLSLKLLNPSLQLSNSQLSPSSKKKNIQILQKLRKQQQLKKKQQQQRKHQQILQKKNAVQIVKQKQSKLKSMALQMKKLVEQYKIIYEQQKQYIKFLQPKIAAILIIPRFSKICREMILQRQRGMKMAWRTRILTKKFTKIIQNKYRQSIQYIRTRKTRQLVGIVNFTTLFSKILYKNGVENAQNVLLSTIKSASPGIIINQAFDHATNYRRSIRYIQKTWIVQYNARMSMFQMYVKDQAKALIIKYPYFKYIQAKFLVDNVAKTLAYKYLADESSKLKYLFEDYKQKLNEIEQFKQMNKKIAQFNKTALKKRQKPYLQVPKQPCYPSSRYFRNISFLKSMIRGWFQLEYRKWSKANKGYLESISTQAKNAKNKSPKKQKNQNEQQKQSPQKQAIKINSIKIIQNQSSGKQ